MVAYAGHQNYCKLFPLMLHYLLIIPHFENFFQNKNNFLYIKDIQKFPAAFFVYLDLKFMIRNILSHHGLHRASSVLNHDFESYISER